MSSASQQWVNQQIRAAMLERKVRALGFNIREGALAPPPLLPGEWAQSSPGVLVRSFDAAAIAANGRTVELFAAPFNRPTKVGDVKPDGTTEWYVESFVPGAFREACADPYAVELDVSHKGETVGHAEHLEERSDGLHARCLLTGSRRGVSRLASLIKSGHLAAASVTFIPVETRNVGGVVQRHKVDLSRIALCRQGAYAEARVLAARAAV